MPAEQRQPSAGGILRDMVHPVAGQTAESQVMMQIHEPVPLGALGRIADRTHQHLRQITGAGVLDFLFMPPSRISLTAP